jgi:ketosteroid isomerase-like protein
MTTLAAATLALTAAAAGCGEKDGQGRGASGSAAAGGAAGAGSGGGPGSSTGTTGTTGTTGSGVAAGSAAAGVAAAGAVLVALPASEVRAFVDRWLEAQNGGDFAAYQALYAAKMEGVKRVGDRTWRFDRQGWLADRQRMFGKPMKVEAVDVEIESSGPTASVGLEQRFAQGSFKDRGPKRLVVVKEDGGLRIAREEMLRSEVGDGKRLAAGQGGVYLVTAVEGKRYLYLALDGVDPGWGKGALSGPIGSEPMLALRAADAAPAAFASWRGREVKAHAADGTSCPAKVGAISLVGGGTPHFGEVQAWNGDPSMSDDGKVVPPAERAKIVFAMGGPYLVGELEVTGSCAPVVVIEGEGKAPQFFAPSEPFDEEEAAALKAFRALPAYRALQKEWKAEWDGKGEWAAQPFLRAFGGAGGKRYVAVSYAAASCGEFGGSLSALFVDRGGKLVPVRLGDAPQFQPQALFDSDGDGEVEAIASGGGFGSYETYFTMHEGALSPAAQVRYPFNDCGC